MIIKGRKRKLYDEIVGKTMDLAHIFQMDSNTCISWHNLVRSIVDRQPTMKWWH